MPRWSKRTHCRCVVGSYHVIVSSLAIHIEVGVSASTNSSGNELVAAPGLVDLYNEYDERSDSVLSLQSRLTISPSS